jgi:hypothetical protein
MIIFKIVWSITGVGVMHSKGAVVIASTSAVVLGGAFVITMAGSQFFSTTDFCRYIRLPDDPRLIESIDWISGISCAYVMAFSRCSKIYHDTYQHLTNKNKNKNAPSYCDSYSLPTHILNVLGTLSGGVRGILLGFLGSMTLLHAVRIYNIDMIYGVAIYVGISNSVTYASFMVGQANKNTELAIQSLKSTTIQDTGNDSALPVQYTIQKKLAATIITLIAMVGSFSYFNYTSYNAFIQMPYLEKLTHESAYYTVSINTVLTIIVGGLAKGLQFYRFLNDKEEENSQQLAKISSAKIKSHLAFGAVYILFYTLTFFIGLINTLNFSPSLVIPFSIFVALCSGALEYIFSVRIMVNEEKKRVLAQQTEASPLLLGSVKPNAGLQAKFIQFFKSPTDISKQTEVVSDLESPAQPQDGLNYPSSRCAIL